MLLIGSWTRQRVQCKIIESIVTHGVSFMTIPFLDTFFFLFRFTCNFIAGTSCDRCYVRLTFPHDYWCLQSKKWSLFSQKRREGNETIFVPTETQSSKPTYHIFIFFSGNWMGWSIYHGAKGQGMWAVTGMLSITDGGPLWSDQGPVIFRYRIYLQIPKFLTIIPMFSTFANPALTVENRVFLKKK